MKTDLTLPPIDGSSNIKRSQENANINRLAYASGKWVAGTYTPNEVVDYLGNLWRCLVQTTDIPTEASANWELWPRPVAEVYTGTPIVDITGTTQVVLAYDAVNTQPSELFTIVGGNLQALVKLVITLDTSFVWTPTIGNNEDAGIIFDARIRSGTGSLPIDNPFGDLFQSSRLNSQPFGASHRLGWASLEIGDVIGVDTSDYPGQTGTSDLDSFHLTIETA